MGIMLRGFSVGRVGKTNTLPSGFIEVVRGVTTGLGNWNTLLNPGVTAAAADVVGMKTVGEKQNN